MSDTEKKKSWLYNFLMRSDAGVSVIVVLLGFLVATFLVICVGRSPAGMYKAIVQSVSGWNIDKGTWNIRYVGEWFNYSIPYILCGFAMAFAGRVGLFNVGGEGQYIMGVTVAQLVAIYFPQIPGMHWMTALVFAILAGAIWGGVVGLLKAKYEVSEVVSTIMLNYVALYLSRIITLAIPGTNTYKTANFPVSASLKASWLEKLTNGSLLNYGIFITILVTIVYWFLMEKTKLGYSLKATGFNRDAAHYAGIPVVSGIVIAMAISGAYAGLGGGIVALGSFKYGRVLSAMDNYGYTGIAVALVGNNKALGVFIAGLLFGMLQASQTLMQSKGIPKEITFIIQGLVVVFVALKTAIRLFLIWSEKRKANAESLAGGKK
ncbi:ABC transporter permease [Treponema zioleckii]|uniref:ABC transporter permease n=1 Tax=Treponema zioleckii TaxID=331680 RepID=UPI00168A808C|nr:ABC transporter permease [Treponema zioleckii]